jgi:hypothetical protein
MEEIVRPFQRDSVIRTKKVSVALAPVTVSDAHFCWGVAGVIPEAVEQEEDFDGLNFRLEECDDDFLENDGSRNNEDFRVENPDDSAQYVMVRRIRQIKFKHEKKTRLLGKFRTDTTAFPDIDPFAGSPFGDVPLTDTCAASFHLNRS